MESIEQYTKRNKQQYKEILKTCSKYIDAIEEVSKQALNLSMILAQNSQMEAPSLRFLEEQLSEQFQEESRIYGSQVQKFEQILYSVFNIQQDCDNLLTFIKASELSSQPFKKQTNEDLVINYHKFQQNRYNGLIYLTKMLAQLNAERGVKILNNSINYSQLQRNTTNESIKTEVARKFYQMDLGYNICDLLEMNKKQRSMYEQNYQPPQIQQNKVHFQQVKGLPRIQQQHQQQSDNSSMELNDLTDKPQPQLQANQNSQLQKPFNQTQTQTQNNKTIYLQNDSTLVETQKQLKQLKQQNEELKLTIEKQKFKYLQEQSAMLGAQYTQQAQQQMNSPQNTVNQQQSQNQEQQKIQIHFSDNNSQQQKQQVIPVQVSQSQQEISGFQVSDVNQVKQNENSQQRRRFQQQRINLDDIQNQVELDMQQNTQPQIGQRKKLSATDIDNLF